MPLKVYPRPSGLFHIRGVHHGQRVDQSARTRNRGEAEVIKETLERRIFEEVYHGKAPKRTFAEAAVGYLKSGGEGRYLERILLMIGTIPLDDIGQGLIEHVAESLYPDAKASTVNRQVHTPISAVLNYAIDEGWTRMRRVRRPRQPAGRVDWRTPAEIEILIAAAPSPLAELVAFYVGTGARASEAIDLEWRDVSPRGERIVLWETKGGYARHVDLGARVRAALPRREGDLVWTRWSGYDAVNRALRRLCAREGLPKVSCHVFRHTWATWAYAVTHDLTFLMSAGGWRTAQMAMRYIHAGTADVADAVRAHGWELGGRREERADNRLMEMAI